jgi:hypothetical protein
VFSHTIKNATLSITAFDTVMLIVVMLSVVMLSVNMQCCYA